MDIKLNILQINTADTKGGAGKVAYLLKNGLKHLGHDTNMIVSKKYSKDPGVSLIKPYSNLRQRLLKKISFWLANDIDLFNSNKILKNPIFKSADIVHCHNLHSYYFNLGTLEKISKLKPVVWTLHDMWPITAHCGHSFDGKLKDNGFFTCPSLDIYPPIAWHNEKYLEKRKKEIYEKSNFHIVTPSKWLADKISQSILKDKPLTIIHNGVDTEIFKPMAQKKARLDLDLPLNKKIILIVAKRGQSNPWKGGSYAQEIIEIYKNRPSIYFIDLGGDKNGSGSNTKTISYVNNEKTLAKYYSAADMLLYPSIADNCPLVVLEAQACGLPVVAFNTGGIPELIEHQKTGYIAKYKDIDGLNHNLDCLINGSEQQIQEIRKRSVDRTREMFTLDLMVDKYLQLYNQVLNLK